MAAAVPREFQLTALDIPYILTLPIIRQQIYNWAENWAVYLAGFGKAGVGLAQSLLAIPGVTVEVIQEVLALNLVGAFETITTAVRDSVIAVVVKDPDPLPQGEKPVVEKPVVETPVVENVKDIPVKPEPVGTPIGIKPKLTTDPSDEQVTPKKPVDATPGNDVAKGPAKADKSAGAKKDKKDAEGDAKPAPGGEDH